MKKVLSAILILFLSVSTVYAKSHNDRTKEFETLIENSGVEKNSISISIKDLKTEKTVYQLHEQILLHPASVQKLLTLIPAIEVLGEDYEFQTSIYSRGKDDYVIKLGADPFFTSSDLKRLAKNIKENTQNVFVDNSIIEDKNWGEGWQWDDDMNVLMPKFNSYNMDKNIAKFSIIPTKQNEIANIINTSKYPFVFINNIKTGSSNNIEIKKEHSISANTLSLNGTIARTYIAQIPTDNLKRYFDVTLTNLLSDNNVYIKNKFNNTQISNFDKELDTISHPISTAIDEILKNSNNLVSETVSKLAGAKATNVTGTDINGIQVFNAYCNKHKLDNSRIKLADASGVSKNNLVTTDFITEFLILNKNNKILNEMATPGEGTLTHRMLPIKNNLKAKTGTLSDISSIAGFLTTKKGHKYAFSIIINDPSSTSFDKKTLEDYLIRETYLKL